MSQAISAEVACRAASALAFSARPRRSALSVHLAISGELTASSSGPGPLSPCTCTLRNCDSTPPVSCARTPRWPSRTPEIDLLGPEILGPDVLVGLLQVLSPAGAAVRRRVQPGRPRVRRVGPVRDPQVDLGIRHPDRGQRNGDVRRQRLPLLRGGELIGDRRDPVVRPGVRVGEQDAVIEIPDGKAGASPRTLRSLSPSAHQDSFRLRSCRVRGQGRHEHTCQRGVGDPGLGIQRPLWVRDRRRAGTRKQEIIPGDPDDGLAPVPGHGLGPQHVLHRALGSRH